MKIIKKEWAGSEPAFKEKIKFPFVTWNKYVWINDRNYLTKYNEASPAYNYKDATTEEEKLYYKIIKLNNL